MSDEPVNDAPADPADSGGIEQATPEAPKKQEPDPAAEAARWKAIALKHEQKLKEASKAEQKLAELEMAGKSETEKLQMLLDQQRAEARDAKVAALRLQVAAEKGLPPGLAKFLPAVDNEIDMMTAADELLEAAGAAVQQSESPSRQPKSPLTSPLADDTDSQRERVLAAMLGRPVS